MAQAQSVAELRQRLEARFGRAILPIEGADRARKPGFATGVHALDRLLPEGVPRGAISVWTGAWTSGRTAATRVLVERTAGSGVRVALVDARRELDPAAWCLPPEVTRRVWVLRPPAPDRGADGAWVAEALLRPGVFGLVVLDGSDPDAATAHRLRILARESDAALLVSCASAPSGWRADQRLEFDGADEAGMGLSAGARFRRIGRVHLHKGASPRTGDREIELVHEPTDRLRTHPVLPDRSPGGR